MERWHRYIGHLMQDCRGTIVPAVALCLIAFVGMAGLFIDGGHVYSTKRKLQGAADSGALAAAWELKRGNSDLQADLRPSAVNDAGMNGFNEVNSTITVSNPPASGRFAGDSNYVEVVIQRDVPTTFAHIFHPSSTTVSARGVAGLVDMGSEPDECILALNRTQPASFRFHGSSHIEASCGMTGNSANSGGMDFSNGISVTATHIGYNEYGGYRIDGSSGSIAPEPTAALPVVDPLGDLEPPNYTGWETASYDAETDTVTCSTGQCVFQDRLQITSSNNAIEFPPGIYVLKDGMELSAGHPITGHGVMFYSEGSTGIRIAGDGDVTFTPPTSGDYKGILLFGSRAETIVSNNVGRGAAQFVWKGVLYFPTQHLDLSGTFYGDGTGASPWGIIITDTLDFGGTTDMNFGLPPESEAPRITKVVLSE